MSQIGTTQELQAAPRRLHGFAHASPEHEAADDGQALGLWRLPAGLLVVEAPAIADASGAVLLFDGNPLQPPQGTIMLGTGASLRRLIAIRPPDGAPLARISFEAQAHVHASASLAEAHPVETFARLLAGDTMGEQARFLRFLVETCGPIFRIARHPGFATFLLRLAHAIVVRQGPACPPAHPLTRPGTPALSMWHVPGASGAGLWQLLSAAGTQRIAPPVGGVLMLESRHAALRASFLLPPPGPDGAARPPLRLAASAPRLPGLLEAGAATAPAERAVARALFRRIAAQPGDVLATRLLRDRRLLSRPAALRRLDDPARPIGGALELAVSDGGGGVFIAGWLRDPLGMVSGGLALRDLMTGQTLPVPAHALHRVARADLAAEFGKAAHGDAGPRPGFLAHLPQAEAMTGGPVAQWGLDLRLASGETIQLIAPPGLLPPGRARALVLRAVHPQGLSAPILDECLTPAVARLQRATLDCLGAPEIIRIGRPPVRAPVAIIIPLYRNLRFLPFQVAAFASDAGLRAGAEIIFVLDSPEQRDAVEHLLRGLHAIHAMPMSLVVMATNAGYASASNAGAAAAGGAAKYLLLLNSDVIPAAPGWVGAMLAPMRRDGRILAVGPKLLFEDGSVQHAGLFFARHGPQGDWLNGHYGKGMPRRHPDVLRARSVPGVTGAALLVRRDAFAQVGGFCTDYVIGDYEDSDLCLRLRALGGDIRYAPAAELYHFERQSIMGHAGYAQTLACAHNRRLHHRRWDATITALMVGFGTGRNAAYAARPAVAA
ncbi:glycosyltransferase [Plastoroseomonas arctica]|uniref:Glycosyltransferase family 2 protein n=1 Tax=Plastoroseomonas arctica TaxID=1509237 RepID=A0AAF1JZH8_9PROT|nr:glycosyltransferase [Plastoroseomonas arctica]MBR0656785.1 glycosyltransferase family 2 protein [Plastoroseomonas arctica]